MKNLTKQSSIYNVGSYSGSGGSNSNYPVHTSQNPKYCVSDLQVSNGLGGFLSTTYTYSNNRIHQGGKGFLGFESITTTDHSTNEEVKSIYNMTPSPYYDCNLATVFRKNTSTNQLVSTNNFTYSTISQPCNNTLNQHFWTKRLTSTETNNLNNATATTINSTFDITSGIATSTSQNINGILSKTSSVTLGAVGSSNRNTKSLTETNTITRVGKAPYTTTTTNTYTNTGLLNSSVSTSGTYTVSKNFDYTIRGNLIQSITTSGNNSIVSDIEYENQNNPPSQNDYYERFIVSKRSTGTNNGYTNLLEESFDFGSGIGTINTMYGKPQSITKSDGLTSDYTYDDWGKLATASDPLGNIINTDYLWNISGFNRYNIVVTSPVSPDITNTVDYIGRTVHSESEGFNNQNIFSDVTYNANGLVQTQTNMHLSSETPITTSYTYDNFNRVSQITTPSASTSYVYTYGLGTSIGATYDANNVLLKKIEKDATGLVIKETDNGGDITYEYNSLGANDAIKLNGNTITTFNYNPNTGALISKQDANSGTHSFVEDEFGRVIQESDANGNVKSYVYDGLGKILSQTIPEGTINYIYSSHTTASGKSVELLDNITGYNGNDIVYQYDQYNRLIEKTNIINGIPRTNRFHYDAVGRADGMEYPTGFSVGNEFDNNGYLTKVNSIGNYNSPNNILFTIYENKTMNGQGQPLTYDMGNGQHSQIDYQYNLPTRLLTSANIQDLNLSYDFTTGNLMQRDDRIHNMHEDFTYDNLQRLTQSQIFISSNPIGLTPHQVTYDAFSRGNIVNKSDVGNYYYSANPLNAVDYVQNPATQTAPTNVSSLNQNIQYTSFDAPSIITENVAPPIAAYQMTIDYAADGNRIISTLNDNAGNLKEERTYLGNFETYKNPSQNIDVSINYISGGSGLCAIMLEDNYSGNQDFYFVYKDQQGSILTLTDAHGQKVYEQNYDAWGRERNAGNWTYTSNAPQWIGNFSWLNRGYTGHEHLKQFGLINMNGRMYDPVLGRMLSPDKFNQGGTQGLNAYSYCVNNPLKFTDPSGWNGVGAGIHTASPEHIIHNDFGGQAYYNYLASLGFGSSTSWSDDRSASGSPISGSAYDNMGVHLTVARYNFAAMKYNAMVEEYNETGGTSGELADKIVNAFKYLEGMRGEHDEDAVININTKTNQVFVGVEGVGMNIAGRSGVMGYEGNNIWDNLSMASDIEGEIFGGLEMTAVTKTNRWLGKNGKYYNNSWGGNQYTGSRSGAFRAARAYKWAGRATVGVSVLIGVAETYDGYQMDGGRFGYNAQSAALGSVGSFAGGWAGAEAGASVGAAVGVWFGGIGAVPGAIIGGIIGGWVGSETGAYVGNRTVKYYYGK